MANPVPSIAEIKKVLAYDPLSGLFTWRERRGSKAAGSVAGNVDPDTGYLRIRVFKKLLYAHRLAWAFQTGEWPEDEIDHRNVNRLDNRFKNLRPAERRENARNTKLSKGNTSGLKGAQYYKRDGCWVAQITVNRKNIYLGRFGSADLAHKAYCRAATQYHGQFARTG